MRKLTFALFILLLLLVAPELILQALDPLQVKPYFADLDALFATMQADPTRGYIHTPGVYILSNWTVTIKPDTFRRVPDTNENASCTIALVGDSATFGHGVNDAETWANLLARQFPTVNILNTGVNGYNIQQVHATIAAVAADGYFYTLIGNDADPMLHVPRPPRPPQSMLEMYLYVFRTRIQSKTVRTPDYRRFDETLAILKQIDVVSIVGFEGDALAQRADVPRLPYWTENNSPVDSHASAYGNVEIASAMSPHMAALVEQAC